MSCNNRSTWTSWKLKHSKLEGHQEYLKSNDTVNLSIKIWHGWQKNTFLDDKWEKSSFVDGEDVTLRSHNVQFTIENNTLQEVACNDGELGEDDEVSMLFYLVSLFLLLF